MKNRNLFTVFCALAFSASACTLPADDAGETSVGEGIDGLENLDGHGALDPHDPQQADEEPDQIFGCSLRVDNPHNSSHVPGTVNVVARAWCDIAIPQIQLLVTLERNGQTVGTQSFSTAGTAALQGNAAATCVDGTYQGRARATLLGPPDALPPNPRIIDKMSASVTIRC